MVEGTKRSLAASVRASLTETLPAGVGWPQTLGSLVLFGILTQVLTGILLAIYYSPSVESAYESVRFIEERVVAGGLIRGLHYWGASLVVVSVLLHLLRTLLWGAYKRPRGLLWMSGVTLLLVILGFGFTGYLLPWDLKAFFATRVGVRIAESIPLAGSFLARLLAGGDDVGQLTLTRFYALHLLVLPGALLVLATLHLVLIRHHGPTPPWRRVGEPGAPGEPFYPHQVLKDSTVALAALVALVAVAWIAGAPLEGKADPTSASYVPRPEWYFYPLFEIQKLFPGSLEFVGAVVVPGALFALLLALPWIDRNPERRLRKRPLVSAGAALGVAGFVALTLTAVLEDRSLPAAGGDEAAAAAVAPGTTPEPAPRGRDEIIAEGKVLYDSLRCGLCHAPPIDEEVPGVPPSLAYHGSRTREAWTVDYLLHPQPRRYARENIHPRVRMPDHYLTRDEAEALAAFLSTRHDVEHVPPYRPTLPPSDSLRAEGERIFDEYACSSCHMVNGKGGRVGPDLTHVASRLTVDYMAAIMKDPKRVIPGNPMTNLRLWDEEVDALILYLRTQR